MPQIIHSSHHGSHSYLLTIKHCTVANAPQQIFVIKNLNNLLGLSTITALHLAARQHSHGTKLLPICVPRAQKYTQ